MLPGKDGISICREIRAKIDIPILMVTARNEDVDKVRGLGIGANEIDFGWFQINHATHRVFVNGSEITIANKEYELLYFLGLHAEMVFSKEQLYDRIWGEDMYGEIKTVSSRGQIRKCGRPPYSVEV
jgi:DNA-binding response OmpR family regulator